MRYTRPTWREIRSYPLIIEVKHDEREAEIFEIIVKTFQRHDSVIEESSWVPQVEGKTGVGSSGLTSYAEAYSCLTCAPLNRFFLFDILPLQVHDARVFSS